MSGAGRPTCTRVMWDLIQLLLRWGQARRCLETTAEGPSSRTSSY